jgi:hypothetical protein
LIVAAGCGKQVALKATIKLHCIRVKEKEAIGVQGLGFKVQGSRFRVQGSGFKGSGFKGSGDQASRCQRFKGAGLRN